MNQTFNLSDCPQHLLERTGHVGHDRKTSLALCLWVERALPYRPSLWAIHEERVKRGLEKPYSTDAALAAVRKRRDEKRKNTGPRRPRRATAPRTEAA